MNHTNPVSRDQQKADNRSISTILSRLAVPSVLFSASLAVVLGISSATLLPVLTTIDVGGVSRDAQRLRVYADTLQQDIARYEGERSAALEPLQDSAYSALMHGKLEASTLEDFLTALHDAISRTEESPGTIVIHQLAFTPEAHQAFLTGDVRNVGPQSMTVLAQLMETLRDDPHVAAISTPKFVRTDDPTIGPHSPFTLTITLP